MFISFITGNNLLRFLSLDIPPAESGQWRHREGERAAHPAVQIITIAETTVNYKQNECGKSVVGQLGKQAYDFSHFLTL
jgi:hypothetical protein